MKPYKAYAHIYSLDGEMDEITVLEETAATRTAITLPTAICSILSVKPCADSAKSSGWNINPSSSLTCIRNRSETINRKNAIFGSIYETESA